MFQSRGLCAGACYRLARWACRWAWPTGQPRDLAL